MTASIEQVLTGEARWHIETGDCLEVLRRMPDSSVDAVITDPPYNSRTHTGAMRFDTASGKPGKLEIPFSHLTNMEFLTECLRVSRGWVIAFCSMEQIGHYQLMADKAWIRAGFWRRSNATPQFTGDRPAVAGDAVAIMHRPGRKRWNGGGSAAYWEHASEQRNRIHPTQKPVPLMAELIEQFTQPGDVVLDPFNGSGTTGVAAIKLGRRYAGIEMSVEYADAARRRLMAETGTERHTGDGRIQMGLFGGAE